MQVEYHSTIKIAYKKGYRITYNGQFISYSGHGLKITCYGNQRYPSYAININGKYKSFPLHKFAAYCFYGNDAFTNIVRHLNANTLDISRQNIVLGTHSDNEHDKPKTERIRVAKLARAAQGKHGLSCKLSKEQIQEIKLKYSLKGSGKAPNGFVVNLAKEYGVCRAVIFNIVKGKSYAS